MPGHPAERRMTVDEFLAFEGEPDTHYELVDGQPMAMAPPSVRHGQIVLRIGRRFLERLPSPCAPVSQAGIRLPDRDGSFYEADIAVTCTPSKPGDRWIVDPILIVEILSPTTKAHDRGIKVADYALIPSLREILLVDGERRHLQLWSRVPEGWLHRDFIGEGLVPLETVPGGITLDDIYEGM